MLEALIFDVDGTLAETEEIHRHAFNAAFAKAGLEWSWTRQDYQVLLTTAGGKERIARYVAEIGADLVGTSVADLHASKTAIYGSLLSQGQISLRPGIADLIAQARAAGLRLAIATTTSLPNVEALCCSVFGKRAGQVFEVIVAGDMVSAKKPAPDAYFQALHQLDLNAGQAVALEDSLNGLRSAKAAGLAVCVAPGVYSLGENLSGADLLVPEFSDLGGLAALMSLRRRKT